MGGGVGWLCLRGGCDGVGVDGCDGVSEGADGALVVVDEGLFEGSFDEGGIGGRDGGPMLGFPFALCAVNVDDGGVDGGAGGLRVALGVVDVLKRDGELAELGLFKGRGDLVEVDRKSVV